MGRQALILACALVVAAPARGEPDDREQEARTLYSEGVTHYDLAEYAVAIEKFKAAYALSRAPRLLFDIAQAYRLQGAGNCRNAAQFYRNYLRLQPEAENRAAVERWLHELEPCEQQEQPAPVVPPPTPPPAPPAPPPPRPSLPRPPIAADAWDPNPGPGFTGAGDGEQAHASKQALHVSGTPAMGAGWNLQWRALPQDPALQAFVRAFLYLPVRSPNTLVVFNMLPASAPF